MAFDPNAPFEVVGGFDPNQPFEVVEPRTKLEAVKDTAIDLGKGIVGYGESLVGAADILTGNAVGRGLAAVGYDPKKTNEMLSSGYSPARQVANENVANASGFMGTLGALVDNPSVAFGAIVESAPMSMAGVAAARFAALRMLKAANIEAGTAAATKFFADPKVQSALVRVGAAAEGTQAAGSIQETGRQEGRAWQDTVAPAVAAGIGTAAIGAATSKIPGFRDAEATVATAGLGAKRLGGNLLASGKEIAKSMFKEGWLEELPQSMQEQIFTNLALDKPWNEGVGAAGAQGAVAGMGQGGGMTAVSEVANGLTRRPATQPAAQEPPVVEQAPVEPLNVVEPPDPGPAFPPVKPKGPLTTIAEKAVSREQQAALEEAAYQEYAPEVPEDSPAVLALRAGDQLFNDMAETSEEVARQGREKDARAAFRHPDVFIPKDARPGLAKMEQDLANSDGPGLITEGYGNNQTVTGRYPATTPDWFKLENLKAHDKKNGGTIASLFNRQTFAATLAAKRAGKKLTPNQEYVWDYILSTARGLKNTDPELAQGEYVDEMAKDGLEPVFAQMPAGNLTHGDEIEIGPGSHIPADRYEVKGYAAGQVVLQDGVEVRVDPWDMLPVDGRKATGKELEDIDVPFGGERPKQPIAAGEGGTAPAPVVSPGEGGGASGSINEKTPDASASAVVMPQEQASAPAGVTTSAQPVTPRVDKAAILEAKAKAKKAANTPPDLSTQNDKPADKQTPEFAKETPNVQTDKMVSATPVAEKDTPADQEGREGSEGGVPTAVAGGVVPYPKTMEEIEELPEFTVYQTGNKDRPFAVRSGNKRGMGDTLHQTIEEAATEEQMARRHAAFFASRAEEQRQQAQEEAAKKSANAALSIAERRANAVLDKAHNFSGIPAMTRRELVKWADGNGYTYSAKEKPNESAKKKDEQIAGQARRQGYLLSPKDRNRGSNANIPAVKAAYEAIDRMESGYPPALEYRLNTPKGSFFSVTKTEYDLAQAAAQVNKTPGTLTSATGNVKKTGENDNMDRAETVTAPSEATPNKTVVDGKEITINRDGKDYHEDTSQLSKPASEKNTIFTEDMYQAARERMRARLNRPNAGLDPEMVQDGIIMAGFHIEQGARTFTAYAKAMIADMGEAVKPYLRSWYMAAKFDPRMSGMEGLSGAAEVESADVDKIINKIDKDADRADNIDGGALNDQIRGNDERISEGQRPEKVQRPPTLWGAAEVLRAESGGSKGNGGEAGAKRDDGLRGGRNSQSGDVQPVDFRITGQLGQGGPKAKFRSNLDAIKLVGEIGNRHATQEEQAVLAKYVGWGGIPQAFYRPDGTVAAGWESEASELKALLPKEEYEAARSTTQDAHYTSTVIIGGIYKGLARLGFTGGKILEPSVGAGNFIGLMPAGIKGKSKITAVEIDKTTSAIAKLLYPQQTVIHSGFQDFTITPESFDLALGNPPFGSKTLFDAQHPGLKSFSIHNYFFGKSLVALREDGLLAMVVSSSMMDKAGGAQRLWLSEKADLLGAIRLPNNAFKGNAGTEVTTDIIFLRKRIKGEPRGGKDWQQIYRVTGKDGVKYDINQYFAYHPEMMLGDIAPNKLFPGEVKDGVYDAVPGLIAREGESLEDALASAIDRLPEKIYKKGRIAEVEKSNIIVSDPGFARPYGYTIDDKGHAVRRRPDVNGEMVFEPVLYADKPIDGKRLERFNGMMRLRDTVRRLIRAELDDSGNMGTLRRQLNSAYDKFVSEFGYISETANSQILNDDPTDFPLLRSLEVKFDKGLSPLVAKKTGEKARKPSAKKAAIFTVRTRQPYRAATSAADAKEALAIVLREDGFLDLSRVASLYGATEIAAAKELEGLIFFSPATGMWETADNYLSGNVKKKLAQAKEAGMTQNIAALERVQPADVPPEKIQFKIGAAWMSGKYYEGFASDVLGQPTSVQHHSKAGLWSIRLHGGPASQYDTSRMSASEIFGRLLEVKDIAVYDLDADKKRILNKDETSIAQIKATEIERAFSDWMLADMDRATGMAKVFNDKVNTNVEPKFDGGHMIFPGMGVINADKTRDNQLREHQKNVVWRMIQKGKGLFDHVVGSGKTYAAIATGMELRRMGLIKKPIYVVPNHLVPQWSVDFQKLYPGANVLTVGKADFSKTKRMEFMGRIATGDWDAVLMAHSSFGFIKSPSDYEAMFYQDQIAQYDEAIEEMRSAEGKSSRSVKQAEKSRDRLKEKLKAIADKPKDDVVDFSELGVDALFTDEAHEFKNLFYVTKRTRVSGLGDPQGSKKAFDMFVKTQYLLGKNNGRGVFFMTGTPVSNTIAEMYTMMRYLDYGRMQEMGIKHFDQWAGMFADVSSDWEVDPTGTRYRLQSSFRGFVNIPGMMGIYKDFTDVITQKNLVAMATARREIWPVPDVKGGKPELVVAERSPLQASFMKWIIHRMDNMPKDPREDNPLKATGEAMKGSLDIRLINESLPDYAGSKVNLAVGNILKINQEWAEEKGTQLIFCDLSVPKKAASKQKQEIAADRAEIARLEGLLETAQGEKLEAIEAEYEKAVAKMDRYTYADLIAADSNFSVYDDVKAKLIAGGMKEGEIAFIHDANTDTQKEELFGKVRSGQIRVLMGSTMKMGAGMNVQNKLVALHHLDAPWRPSDLEQREGRIIRQGNDFFEESLRTGKKFEVGIYRYATKESLDTRRWQVIERKAKVVEQLRGGGHAWGEMIEDASGEAANAAEMKAAASGNPLILDEIKLRKEIDKIEAQKRGWQSQRFNQERIIRQAASFNDNYEVRLKDIEKDVALVKKHEHDPWQVEVNGELFAPKLVSVPEATGVNKKEVTEAEEKNQKAMEKAKKKLATALYVGIKDRNLSVKFKGVTFEYDAGAFSYWFTPDLASIQTYADLDSVAKPNITYLHSEDFSATGFVTRMNNMLNVAVNKESDIRARLIARQKQHVSSAETAKAQLAKGFDGGERLADARKEHAEVLAMLQTDAHARENDEAQDFSMWTGKTTIETADLVRSTEASEEVPLYSRANKTEWPDDFPNATTHTTMVKLKAHPDYEAAKAGDVEAAIRLVGDLVNPAKIKEMKARHPDAIVVAPHAIEAAGKNAIPRVLAEAFGDAGFGVNTNMVQTNEPHRTKKDSALRLALRPEFAGDVEAGQEYILLDDAIGQGGTVAELRFFIESNGGRVVDVSALTSGIFGNKLSIRSDTIQKLEEKFSREKLEKFLDEFNTAGRIEALTEKEGRYILRQVSLDSLRDQILADAREAGINPSAWQVQASLSRLASRSTTTGTTVVQVETELRTFLGKGYDKLTGSGKLRIVQSVEELPSGGEAGIMPSMNRNSGTGDIPTEAKPVKPDGGEILYQQSSRRFFGSNGEEYTGEDASSALLLVPEEKFKTITGVTKKEFKDQGGALYFVPDSVSEANSIHPISGEILLAESLETDKEELKKTLTHELTHWEQIQSGTAPTNFYASPEESIHAFMEYLSDPAEVSARFNAEGKTRQEYNDFMEQLSFAKSGSGSRGKPFKVGKTKIEERKAWRMTPSYLAKEIEAAKTGRKYRDIPKKQLRENIAELDGIIGAGAKSGLVPVEEIHSQLDLVKARSPLREDDASNVNILQLDIAREWQMRRLGVGARLSDNDIEYYQSRVLRVEVEGAQKRGDVNPVIIEGVLRDSGIDAFAVGPNEIQITLNKKTSEKLASIGEAFRDAGARPKEKLIPNLNSPPSDGGDVTLLSSKDGSIAGTYNPKTGQMTLVADSIREGDAKYIMLHEGGHALIREDPIFAKQYDAIIDQFNRMKRYDRRVQDAYQKVPNDTRAHQVDEEALMYFVQDKANHKTSLFKKIIANIRMWLMRMGIPMKNLTTDDLVALFTQGVKGMANQAAREESSWAGEMALAFSKQFGITVEEAQRQYDEVVAKYKGTTQWMKTPTGEPTKLNERQWVQTRTAAFKDWFGDFELAHYMRESDDFISRVMNGARPGNIKAGVVSGKVAARIKHLTGVNVNGASFELVANDIAHSIKEHGNQAVESKRGQEAITAEDLKLLPIILGAPTRVVAGTAQAGRQSVLFEKKINGTLVVAEIVPSGGGSMLFKTAWKRPSEKTDAVSLGHTPEAVLSPPHSYSQNIQQLLEESKASSVVDENGEPMVVYHGTLGDFNIFDRGMAGKNTSHPTASLGIFTTSSPQVPSEFIKASYNSKEEARAFAASGLLAREMANDAGFKDVFYMDPASPERKAIHAASNALQEELNVANGGNIMPLYLSLKNPLRISWAEWSKAADWIDGGTTKEGIAEIKAKVKTGHHDGLILEAQRGRAKEYAGATFIAFSPDQIKSAIGNTGQFSPHTNDIRYSKEQIIEAAKAIYSKLEQVAKINFLGMKAQGVVNNLLKYGVKKAEMEAVGLNEWLATKKPTDKVTQADLVDFVKANTVELEDVVLGGEKGVDEWKSEQSEVFNDMLTDADYLGFDSAGEARRAILQNEDWKDRWDVSDVSGLGEMGDEYRKQKLSTVPKTHFSQYTEPGAVEGSYREMFVTAPVVGTAAERASLTEPLWVDGHGQYAGIKNPVVRIRFNSVEADEKNLLRIEEMQGPNPANQSLMPAYLRDNIYQLGVKRILAYAKENGFDGVALATKPGLSPGQTQADRYSLEKQVKEIRWVEIVSKKESKDGKERYAIGYTTLQGESNGRGTTYLAEELEDVIGKGLAREIINSPNSSGKFEGDGLRLHGGQGLKQLYDTTLPAMLEAYGKGEMEAVETLSPQDKSGERWVVLDSEDRVIRRGWSEDILRKELEPGQRVAYQEDKPSSMPYLPLENAPASYPMFSIASLENLEEVAKTMGSITVKKRSKPDSTFLDRIFSTPEYYFKKFAAAGRVLQAALLRRDVRFTKEQEILGKDFVNFVQALRKENRAAYDEANDYLIDHDQSGEGFSLKEEDETWKVVSPDGKMVSRHDTEQEAVAAMVEAEGAQLAKDEYSADAIKAVRLARELTNRGFDVMAADMRKIIEEAKKAGLPNPLIGDGAIDEAGRYGIYGAHSKKPIALFATERQANEAMARAAQMISYVVQIKGGGERNFMSEIKANAWAKKHSGSVNERKTFDGMTVRMRTDVEMRPMTVQQALAQMGDMRGTYFPRIRKPGEYVLIARKDGENPIRKSFDLPMLGDDKNPTLQKLGNMGTPMGREAMKLKAQGYDVTMGYDESPVDDMFSGTNLTTTIDAILQDSMAVIDKNNQSDIKAGQQINQLITMQVADIFKARGYLSSRLKRMSGDTVWEGYETDMGKALTQYGKGIAAGTAKRDTARAMVLAFSGRDYSWDDYKQEVDKPAWSDYQEIVEQRRIDPRRQKNLFVDVRSFMIDVLRNDEKTDRIIGTMKGLAVLKFLAFRVSSAAVNATNMVTGVPATLSGHVGISLGKAGGHIGKAVSAYAKYRTGKGEMGDRAIFQEITDRGWDDAQFNQEAARELRGELGEAWNKIMTTGMFMFGAVEKANRATTIFAAYKAVQEKSPDLSAEQIWTKAKEVSDRAHGVYGKETRPAWTRGGDFNRLLALPYTFAKFSHNYMLNMIDLGYSKREYQAAAYLLLSPAILSGAGATLATPILMGLASALGIGGDDPEEEYYKWAEETFGTDAFARHGLAGLAGINLKGSLQIHNPMPTKLSELGGAPGAIVTEAWKAIQHFGKGEIGKGAEALLPTAFGSMSKATREATEGITTSNYGQVFYGDEPLKADNLDAALRFFSFNPARLSGIREKQWNEKEVAAKYQDRKKEIYSKIKRLHIQGKGITPEVNKEIVRYNDLVKGSGRSDIHPITPKKIRLMLKMNSRASKFERDRVANE